MTKVSHVGCFCFFAVADKGEFEWDQEEDFEVEAILDYGIADVRALI